MRGWAGRSRPAEAYLIRTIPPMHPSVYPRFLLLLGLLLASILAPTATAQPTPERARQPAVSLAQTPSFRAESLAAPGAARLYLPMIHR
jgi:hypothetical protein